MSQLRTLVPIFLTLISSLVAQSDPTPGNGKGASPGDPSGGNGATSSQPVGTLDRGAVDRRRQEQIDSLLAQATAVRRWHDGQLKKPEANEAKRQEALLLLQAGLIGDTTQLPRRSKLVDELRNDTAVPVVRRCELVAMTKYAQAQINRIQVKGDRVAAIERIERDLIAEFPAAPNGYEGLLNLARYCNDPQGKALARELMDFSGAPAAVRAEARQLSEQYDLLGVPLADILPADVLKQAMPVSAPSQIVIYACSMSSKASEAVAQFLVTHAPRETWLIRIDIDPVSAAPAVEPAHGVQLYDATGAIAARMKWAAAPQVYIVGPDGKISSIAGMRELGERWASGMAKSQTEATQ